MTGFPAIVAEIGHGSLLGIPVPLIIFAFCVVAGTCCWRTRLGFDLHARLQHEGGRVFRDGRAPRLDARLRPLGVMSAIAGIVMLARFNSVRVGHGESYLLVTVLARFLGRSTCSAGSAAPSRPCWP